MRGSERERMGKGRAPCCDKTKVKRGPWSPEEDIKLISFIQKFGHENWRSLPKQSGMSLLLSSQSKQKPLQLFFLFFIIETLEAINKFVDLSSLYIYVCFQQIWMILFIL